MFNKKRTRMEEIEEMTDDEVTELVENKDKYEVFHDELLSEIIHSKIDPYCPIEVNLICDHEDIVVNQVNFASEITAVYDNIGTDEFFAKLYNTDYRFAYEFGTECIDTMTITVFNYLESIIVNSTINIINPLIVLTNSEGNSLLDNINFLGAIRTEVPKHSIQFLNIISEAIKIMDIREENKEEINVHYKKVQYLIDLIIVRMYSIICTGINRALDDFCFGDNQDEVYFVYKNILNILGKMSGNKGFKDINNLSVKDRKNMQIEVKNFFLGMFLDYPLKDIQKWLNEQFREEFFKLLISCTGSALPYNSIKYYQD